MQKSFLALSLAAFAPLTLAAEPFCDSGHPHPIDVQFERDMDASGGVTLEMRNAQGRAYKGWDTELNMVYQELMESLASDEQAALKKAQRAWLTFREAETEFWWTESLSGGGTLQPVIVADQSISLLKARVCQLKQYKQAADHGLS
ncbi:lysozyme inhibitor LprI family protein [Halomonas garicola]|uniref:lysozyme inhibitor LprI family protein n=1 Tax=Halomonas garicola TaxID=1690008 RepID=UPI00289A63B3|nr:lysozyme inhibitor LprI family protein [Halomonas garicola]